MGSSMWWLLVVGFLVMAGNGYPEEDLVVKLPGQPRVGFKQYVGYIDVDVKVGRSLFYYFVEAEHDPDYKPLTLWLNGGPGCSSIGGGAFTELGPFFPTGDGRGLRRNPKSWNKASNLLFVESPTGVGWSYSNTTSDYTCGDASAAMDMHIFLMKWVEKFPSFKSRDLFLTGESYAGHYIPQLAVALLDHNEHSKGYKFNIKGVAVRKQLPETFAVASIEQPCPIVMRLKRWERKKCKPNSLPVLQKCKPNSLPVLLRVMWRRSLTGKILHQSKLKFPSSLPVCFYRILLVFQLWLTLLVCETL